MIDFLFALAAETLLAESVGLETVAVFVSTDLASTGLDSTGFESIGFEEATFTETGLEETWGLATIDLEIAGLDWEAGTGLDLGLPAPDLEAAASFFFGGGGAAANFFFSTFSGFLGVVCFGALFDFAFTVFLRATVELRSFNRNFEHGLLCHQNDEKAGPSQGQELYSLSDLFATIGRIRPFLSCSEGNINYKINIINNLSILWK